MCRWRYSLYVVCETTLCWGRIRLWLGAKRLLTNPSSSRMKTRIEKHSVQRRCCLRFAWKKRKWAEECCQSVVEMWDASLIRICEEHLPGWRHEWVVDGPARLEVWRSENDVFERFFFCRISSKARWIFPSIKVDFFLYEMPMFHEDFVQFLKRCVQWVTNDEPEFACLPRARERPASYLWTTY